MGAKFGTDLKPITSRTMVNYKVKLIHILFSQFGTRYIFFFFFLFVSSDSEKHFKKIYCQYFGTCVIQFP